MWLDIVVGLKPSFQKWADWGLQLGHMTPAHLIPSLESITTERIPSETTRDNKPSVPDCCCWYRRVRNRWWWHKETTIPEVNMKFLLFFYFTLFLLYFKHAESHFHTDDGIRSHQSQISYALSITCFFWSIRIESVFTYIICRPKQKMIKEYFNALRFT